MLDLIEVKNICRTFYPKAPDYIFLPSAHETSSQLSPMLGHKSNLNKLSGLKHINDLFF